MRGKDEMVIAILISRNVPEKENREIRWYQERYF